PEDVGAELHVLATTIARRHDALDQAGASEGVEVERQERGAEPERSTELARRPVARNQRVDDRETRRVAERRVDLGPSLELHGGHRSEPNEIVQRSLNEVGRLFTCRTA